MGLNSEEIKKISDFVEGLFIKGQALHDENLATMIKALRAAKGEVYEEMAEKLETKGRPDFIILGSELEKLAPYFQMVCRTFIDKGSLSSPRHVFMAYGKPEYDEWVRDQVKVNKLLEQQMEAFSLLLKY